MSSNEIAARLLTALTIPLDRLPYTIRFEQIYAQFQEQTCQETSRHEVWRTLLRARKKGRGRLPGQDGRRARRATVQKVAAHHLAIATRLLGEMAIQPDHLPYTTAFEVVHQAFNCRCKQSLSENYAWHCLVGARKRKRCQGRLVATSTAAEQAICSKEQFRKIPVTPYKEEDAR